MSNIFFLYYIGSALAACVFIKTRIANIIKSFICKIVLIFVKLCVGLLVLHRVPFQVADRGTPTDSGGYWRNKIFRMDQNQQFKEWIKQILKRLLQVVDRTHRKLHPLRRLDPWILRGGGQSLPAKEASDNVIKRSVKYQVVTPANTAVENWASARNRPLSFSEDLMARDQQCWNIVSKKRPRNKFEVPLKELN